MLLVGLTGGIGTGKSTVAQMLAVRGAVVVDADALAREAIEPGTPGFEKVVERFGDELVDLATGGVDRKGLAAIVFADEQARKDLESIIHPEVGRRMVEEVARYRDTDQVVVYDAALIVEGGFADVVDRLVVVTAPREEQIERLVRARAMDPEEVEARIGAQAPTEEKEARADVVIRNDGSTKDLEAQVDRLWDQLQAEAAGTARPADGSPA